MNIFMIVFPWVLAFGVFLPASLGLVGHMVIEGMGQCETRLSNKAFAAFNLATTYTPHIIAGGGSIMIVWKTYLAPRCVTHSQVVHPSINGAYDFKAQRSLARRARMAKMLFLTLLWTLMCNVPWFVMLTQFPDVLARNPMSGLWQQVASTSQYAFAPVRYVSGKGFISPLQMHVKF